MKYIPVPNDQYTDKMAKRDKRVINKAIKEAMSDSTQNDWADAFRAKFEGKNVPMNSVHPIMIDSQIIYIQKLLADARKEVIESIESKIDKARNEKPYIHKMLGQTSREAKERHQGFISGLLIAKEAVESLATLKEEGK